MSSRDMLVTRGIEFIVKFTSDTGLMLSTPKENGLLRKQRYCLKDMINCESMMKVNFTLNGDIASLNVGQRALIQ